MRDVSEARSHPLLKDQYFTTGSFISFPLVYHDELIGVDGGAVEIDAPAVLGRREIGELAAVVA